MDRQVKVKKICTFFMQFFLHVVNYFSAAINTLYIAHRFVFLLRAVRFLRSL